MAGSTNYGQSRVSETGNTFPSIGRIIRNICAGLALSFPLTITWSQPAQAVLIFNFYESGSDLVIMGTGTLYLPTIGRVDETGGTVFGSCEGTSTLALDIGFCIGEDSLLEVFDITGPTTLAAGLNPANISAPFGSSYASSLLWNTGTGSGVFAIDRAYRGSRFDRPFIGTRSTFSGITLASLGLPASGTLGTWTLINSFDPSYIGDTIIVKVNASSSDSPASVPGPLPLLGLGAAFGISRKLRKRIKPHRGTRAVSTSVGAYGRHIGSDGSTMKGE